MLYNREFQADPNDPEQAPATNGEAGPRLDDLEFWHKLIALITTVIEEDKSSYGPVLNQFPQELNMGDVSISLNAFQYLLVQLQEMQGIINNHLPRLH